MDILAYEYLKEGLKDYNEKSGKPYGNVIVSFSSTNSTYPHTAFDEIRNVSTNMNSDFDRVSSLGFAVRIYAKTKGNITKQTIARTIAEMVDNYMRHFKLNRVSYNANESVNDNSIYEIVMTYTGNLHENRRKFI